jgi:hypothetical protein
MNLIPITYGEFYDVPRMIRFQLGGQWYFLRSPFDEEQDDYIDSYDVYLLPFRSEEEFQANPNYWRELNQASYLGRIPIREVGLDETRRRSIDADAMEQWLSTRKKESDG